VCRAEKCWERKWREQLQHILSSAHFVLSFGGFQFFCTNERNKPSVCLLHRSSLNGLRVGRDSSVGVATSYGPGIESSEGQISRTRPYRPWGLPNLLHSGCPVSLPEAKRPGRGFDYPPSSNAAVKERVVLYLCSSYGPAWAVNTVNVMGNEVRAEAAVQWAQWWAVLVADTVTWHWKRKTHCALSLLLFWLSARAEMLVKVKLALSTAWRHAEGLTGHTAPLVLNLDTSQRSVINFTPPAALLPTKNPGAHWMEAGWAPGPVWTFWSLLPLLVFKPKSLYRLETSVTPQETSPASNGDSFSKTEPQVDSWKTSETACHSAMCSTTCVLNTEV